MRVAREDEWSPLTAAACECIVSLLNAAFFEDDLEATAVHLGILKSVLYAQSATSGVDKGLLFAVLWYDFQQASKALTSPVLGFSGWATEQYRPGWEQALKDLPPFSSWAEADVNESIRDERPKGVFIRLRDLLEISDLLSAGSSNASPATKMGVVQWALIRQGPLDLCVDANSAISQDWKVLGASPGLEWTPFAKVYTCLAALWWTRRLKRRRTCHLGGRQRS